MDARVGLGNAPVIGLAVEIVEMTEAPGEEEILADVAKGSFDFPLGLGAVRSAGSGCKPIHHPKMRIAAFSCPYIAT